MNHKFECIKYVILKELKYSFESLRKDLTESQASSQGFWTAAELLENMLENVQLIRY